MDRLSLKDMRILSFLRKNARLSLTKMSRKTGIPVSTLYDKIKALESRVISRWTALIDFNAIGFTVRVAFLFKAGGKNHKDKVVEFLKSHPSVNNLYKVNSSFSFYCEMVFKSIKDLEDFIEHISEKYKVKHKVVTYIVEDIKRESFMSDPELSEIFYKQ